MIGIAQRRRLRISCVCLLPYVGRFQHIEALRVGRHNAILDSVMHHLDEVTAAAGTAMQVALFSCACKLLPSRRAWNIADAWCDRFENGIEVLHRRVGP